MPKSRVPHGIQFDSPLQRQWMIRSSIGSDALNAATVLGASSSSQRATKRIPAATISSTRETLPALRRQAKPERDEHDTGDDVDYSPHPRHEEHPGAARDERQPAERQRGEQEPMGGEPEDGAAKLRQQTEEEDGHLRVREVAHETLPVG